MSISFKNFAPIFVETFTEKGGLNHVMFLFLIFLFLSSAWGGGSNTSWWAYPLSWRAFWYTGAACLKIYSLEDMDESLLFIASGIFFKMFGGWLLWLWTYRGLSFGLMNGLKVSVFRFKETSRKSTIFIFASIVILRLYFENTFVSYFYCWLYQCQVYR